MPDIAVVKEVKMREKIDQDAIRREQEGSFRNQVDYYTRLIETTPVWELAGIFADND